MSNLGPGGHPQAHSRQHSGAPPRPGAPSKCGVTMWRCCCPRGGCTCPASPTRANPAGGSDPPPTLDSRSPSQPGTAGLALNLRASHAQVLRCSPGCFPIRVHGSVQQKRSEQKQLGSGARAHPHAPWGHKGATSLLAESGRGDPWVASWGRGLRGW